MSNISKTREPRFWKLWKESGAVKPPIFNQQKHPEIFTGEVWITNADHESFCRVGWTSKRAGVIALDKYGVPLGRRWPGSFPVFAQRTELAKSGVSITR
jgi:hypothetical protein